MRIMKAIPFKQVTIRKSILRYIGIKMFALLGMKVISDTIWCRLTRVDKCVKQFAMRANF